MGFVTDLNSGYGRNKKTSELPSLPPDAEDETINSNLDDDLKAAMAKMRSTGKSIPKRITSHQRQIVEKLIAAHGSNIQDMARDRKLNKMQHSQGYLTKMIESYEYWKKDSKNSVDFRVPNKGLW